MVYYMVSLIILGKEQTKSFDIFTGDQELEVYMATYRTEIDQ